MDKLPFIAIILTIGIETAECIHSNLCNLPNVTCSEQDLVKIYWDLNGLHQEDPQLIEAIQKHILVPPNSELVPLSLSHQPTKNMLNGQFGQVEIIEDLLMMKKKGFFIEAGAGCGEKLSNTLYLEIAHQWTGLLIEPNPDLLKALYSKHRNGWIFPHCLSPTPYVQTIRFEASSYLSGIILEGKPKPSQMGSHFNADHKQENGKEIQVQCFPLYSVLKAMGNPPIDYFSLDIEGAEFAVLNTIPWKDVTITAVGVEINHAGDIFDGNRYDIGRLLEKNGFKYVGTAWIDDFFLSKKYLQTLTIESNKNET